MNPADAETLRRIHELRMKAHGWPQDLIAAAPWPKTDAEWRQTDHGAPWDTNVQMAKWHLAFARKLIKEGIIA